MAIDWSHLEQPQFDRIVEALWNRLYGFSDVFEVYDGRGGDGGRDIVVRHQGHLTIYQLKFFPEGFSANWSQRRKQIKNSFKTAAQHAPDSWTLVVPCNLTHGERQYLRTLQRTSGVKISYRGRSFLDHWLSLTPDLVTYFVRDELERKARIFSQETAVMLGGTRDLTNRVRDLGTVVDTVDPDWTFDFARVGDTVVHTLRAKHERAAEVSPITIDVGARFGPGQGDLQDAYTALVEYGIGEAVVLPPDVVQSFVVHGPPLVAEVSSAVEVHLVPDRSQGAGRPFELRLIDGEGRLLSNHTGTTQYLASAARGSSIKVSFYGAVSMIFKLPLEAGDGDGGLRVDLNLSGLGPAELLHSLELVIGLEGCRRIEFSIDGSARAIATFTGANAVVIPADHLEDFERLRAVAEDLDILQRFTRNYFPVPTTIGAEERLYLRAARLLIDGHCVALPGMAAMTARLTGELSDEVRDFFEGDSVLVAVSPDSTFEMFGRSFLLGQTKSFATGIIVEGKADHLDALEQGRGEGRTVKIRPRDRRRFWTFLEKAYRGRDDESPEPVGWGLADFDDPEDVVALRARA